MKNIIILLALVAIITPVVVNAIISVLWPYASGSADSWINFFGSYVGGIIGALVAFTIAKYQVEVQVKLNKDQIEYSRQKDNLLREYSQLPYLIKIKFILQEMKSSLKYASDLVNGKVPSPQGNGYIQIDFGMIFDTGYKLKPEAYNYLNYLVDVDLHVKLLELFNFYKEFSKALIYDPNDDIYELNELKAKLDMLQKKTRATDKELRKLEADYNKLNHTIQLGAFKKQVMWKELQDKKYYELVCELEGLVTENILRIKDQNASKAA